MTQRVELAAGGYTVRNPTAGTSATVTVPALTASIDQTSPTEGQTLTLTTNAAAGASIQWRRNGSNLSGATSSSLVTTTGQAGSIDCVVGSGAQSVTTAAVTLGAAATTSIAPQTVVLASGQAGSHTLLAGFSASTGQGIVLQISSRQQTGTFPNDTIASVTIGGQALTVLAQGQSAGPSGAHAVGVLTGNVTSSTEIIVTYGSGSTRSEIAVKPLVLVGYNFGAIVSAPFAFTSTNSLSLSRTINTPASAAVFAVQTSTHAADHTMTGVTETDDININPPTNSRRGVFGHLAGVAATTGYDVTVSSSTATNRVMSVIAIPAA